LGDAIDQLFGARTGTEAVANYLALQLGTYLGLPTPTASEFGNTGYEVFQPARPSTGGGAGACDSGARGYAYAPYDGISPYGEYVQPA
jgi:hypothetical protein